MKKRAFIISFALLFTGLVMGLILSSNLGIQQLGFSQETGIPPSATNFLGKLSTSLSEVAGAVKPSIVNISTTMTVTSKGTPFGGFSNDPFFRKFFGPNLQPFSHERKFKESALGSGVIITKDGYILTNNHVVKNADTIKVILNDKREYKGKVIGSDPKTDLAVVKIDAKGLPAIKIGDSDKLTAGDMVLAIGNPFGLSQTVTMGIVSAVGRSNVGIADYEDFIQTDAAINPGNSGGALVNSKGELVGINTAIFSTSGGYMGVGFAIPSNMAKRVMESITKYGKVIRGWLGVTIQNLTPDIAKHLGIKQKRGALVTDVIKDSPAGKAGFKRGDLIVRFDGKPVTDTTELRNRVAQTRPGKIVEVKVIRDGKERVLTVTISELAEKLTATAKKEYKNVLKGVYVQDLTPAIRNSLNIPQALTGVIVTNIDGNSPAFGILHQRDVILQINKKAIKSSQDYEKTVSGIGPDDSVLLLIYRAGGYIYITINP
ncbi:putative periplasmic serine endoprotease DegP-like precursor [bacterium BMS3Bbin06]|nr:putative periplasmic serine endoprotease DegP-like precursor [bacterium BMS3Abin08]GBE34572.1 putative periplasmic serine endoprotease DegP-like precursor [bacterium BMS3Bbin06]HDO35180.1 DegQ family serine endoprotease [Nitrospirota bacterium]HDY72211.1 DegQ family serine endoprotease [Nitrospirota bacterium]